MLGEAKRCYEMLCSEAPLERAVEDEAVKHVADVFHYLVIHANVKQYYYELKFIRSDARLLELIGKALRHLDILSRDKDHEEKIKQFLTPSKEDEAVVLKYYGQLRADFIKAISGLALASCPLCWAERKSRGGE
jgi:hypothetical protein